MPTAIILGATGLVGSAVSLALQAKGVFITNRRRDTVGVMNADYVFDCAGESRTYMHETKPEVAFNSSVTLAYNNVLDNVARLKYVYVSSSRVYPGRDGSGSTEPVHPATLLATAKRKRDRYARNKLLAETIVLSESSVSSVVRICGVVGRNFYKGPVYDLIHNPQSIRVTLDSRFQIMHADDLAKHIVDYTLSSESPRLLNLGATDSQDLYSIARCLGISVNQEYATTCEACEPHVVDYIQPSELFVGLPKTLDAIEKLK